MTSHLPITWKRKRNWMISFQSFTDTHVHAFSCNYRIKKQNTPSSYFCTNNVGCICTVSGCLISTNVLLCAALTLPPSGFWLQRLFWSSFSVFWKENLKFEMEKTAGFKCWSGHNLPQRSLQEILISSDLAVSEWRSIKPPLTGSLARTGNKSLFYRGSAIIHFVWM